MTALPRERVVELADSLLKREGVGFMAVEHAVEMLKDTDKQLRAVVSGFRTALREAVSKMRSNNHGDGERVRKDAVLEVIDSVLPQDDSYQRGVIHGVEACITALRSGGSDDDYPRAIKGEKTPSSIGALAFFFSQIAEAARKELKQPGERVRKKWRTRFPCRDCTSNGECEYMHPEGGTMEGHDCAMFVENRAPWREPRCLNCGSLKVAPTGTEDVNPLIGTVYKCQFCGEEFVVMEPGWERHIPRRGAR